MLFEGKPGEQRLADGAIGAARLSRTGEFLNSQLHARFFETCQRGNLFAVSTAVAGVAPGTALSTTPPMALWNPLNSKYDVAITRVFLGYVSGTLGAGTMVHAYTTGQSTVPSGGSELQPVGGYLSAGGGVARAFQGSTLATTPLIVRPSIVLGAGLATTPQLPAAPAADQVDGAIVIPPGGVWVYQGVAAAGTSPLVLVGVEYEEVPQAV